MSEGMILLCVPFAGLAALLYLNAYLCREPADAGDGPRRRRTDLATLSPVTPVPGNGVLSR
ncbi:hypothetical protein Asp14428_57270 [Actinoplanes sp. NBRC 14428]|uniref:Uncharacterized protein n=1 Tax=Pseudosporangium ferrugineum TaxID=439699 RepID=A0A2T0RDT9_9ACTN|nr:hypothetical protein CLV70_13532 [Pseudosporangium ferrugineum]BCJ54252.1 hypothetical protein Asp14428_57270 [Actinoplanes sp. NBRC 14428]